MDENINVENNDGMQTQTTTEKTSILSGLSDKLKNSFGKKNTNDNQISDFDDGVLVTDINNNPNSGTLKADSWDKFLMKMNAPKLKDKTNFFRLLAVSQKAGLGMMDSLSSLKMSEKNKGMYNIISDIMYQLGQGSSLADAMMNHNWFFGENEIELVRASQVSGNLIETLNQIADELEENDAITGKVKSAMRYPIILLVVAVGASAALLIFILPNIVGMFSTDESALPGITKTFMAVGDFLSSWKGLLLGGIIAGVIITYKFLYANVISFKKFIDHLVLQLPVASDTIKAYYMYQFAQLLSQFYSAGISPTVSLGLLANIFSNFDYKKKMVEIKKDMAAGFTYYESMDGSTLFDSLFVQIMHVGEDTGAIGEVLGRIATFYKRQFVEKLDALTSLITPIMTCLIAVLIGGIVAAIYLPMVSIMDVL